MTLRFVSTSILTSEDGIDFSKETAVESQEVNDARLAAQKASSKPLYAQLAEIRDRKQEEYDANTKKIFAPPKALDDEDVAFFDDLEDNKKKLLSSRKEREAAAVESFKMAQHNEDNIQQHQLPHIVPLAVQLQQLSSSTAAKDGGIVKTVIVGKCDPL